MNDNKWVTHWCINQWAPITQSRSCTHKDTIIAVQYSWHGVHNYNVAVMWVETYASKYNLKSTSKSSFKVTNQVATFDKMCIFWLANSFIYLATKPIGAHASLTKATWWCPTADTICDCCFLAPCTNYLT